MALQQISKRFGSFPANDDVSLTVGRGEVHALLGENGAGKSTLVKIVAGLLQPDHGSILWEGSQVEIGSPEDARRLGIGMVFQHFSTFDGLSVLENVALGLSGRRADSRLRVELSALSERFQLAIPLDASTASLSAGERQRIEIVRALLQRPKLLILDEPTSVLTPQEAEALFATLRRLASEGTSILFISHKLDEVRQVCTAATILRGGKVVARVNPAKETNQTLARAMVGAEVEGSRRGQPPATGPRDIVLAIENLTVRPEFAGVPLREIGLTVGAGQIVAIAGVAGSGQSELFAAISGEGGAIEAGSIRIAGRDVTHASISVRRHQGAAFVPEDRLGQATLPDARLSENLILTLPRRAAAGRWGWLRRADLQRRVEEVRRVFDVRTSAADPAARRLSGGNLQKYVLGREILERPRLLVVNQPTWGVDVAATGRIRQSLLELAAEGTAILMISQDLDEVLALADQVAVMRGGRLSRLHPAGRVDRDDVGLLMTVGEEPRDAA